jgi:hypothetical protein
MLLRFLNLDEQTRVVLCATAVALGGCFAHTSFFVGSSFRFFIVALIGEVISLLSFVSGFELTVQKLICGCHAHRMHTFATCFRAICTCDAL